MWGEGAPGGKKLIKIFQPNGYYNYWDNTYKSNIHNTNLARCDPIATFWTIGGISRYSVATVFASS